MSSASVLTRPASCEPPVLGDFCDLIDHFAPEDELPETAWLKQLQLSSPQLDLHSLPRSARVQKRLLDICGAGCVLVLCAPVLLVVSLLVKASSRGTVLRRETRVGLNLRQSGGDRRSGHTSGTDQEDRRQRPDRRQQNNFGRPFTLYTFRTTAEEGSEHATSVGRVLRRTRVEKLPQLWNVLRGDMSLVGPRPESPEFIAEISRENPGYLNRLALRPGITDLTRAVRGTGGEVHTARSKVAWDLLYLRNCSVTTDLKILAQALRSVFRGTQPDGPAE